MCSTFVFPLKKNIYIVCDINYLLYLCGVKIQSLGVIGQKVKNEFLIQ